MRRGERLAKLLQLHLELARAADLAEDLGKNHMLARLDGARLAIEGEIEALEGVQLDHV